MEGDDADDGSAPSTETLNRILGLDPSAPTAVASPDRARNERARTLLAASGPFLAYLAAQAFVVAGLVTSRYPDSPSYLQISFTGSAQRLWVVPVFYNLFPNDPSRVAGQVVLAAACWWTLAWAASRLVDDRRIRLGLRIVLLMLGLASPIAEFNSTILSESVAISLFALAIGMWILHVSGPTWRTGAAVVVSTLLTAFTRPDLLLLEVALAIVVAIATIVHLRGAVHVAVAVALVAISAYGFAIAGRNPQITGQNLADIIQDKILPNPGWTKWFVAHGMPYSRAVQATAGGVYGLALDAMPTFSAWLDDNGARTYAEFVLLHPGYALWDPLAGFSGEEASLHEQNTSPYPYTQPNPTPSMLSPDANYGRHRDIFPTVVEELLFEQGQIGDVLALAAAAFGCAYLARRRLGRDPRMWVPVLLTVSVVPQAYLEWLLGGEGEVDRQSIVLATVLRIGLWIIFGYALDRLLIDRHARATARVGTTRA